MNSKNYPAIMVVGPNASSMDVLLGNYHGIPDKAVNFAEGITAAVDAGTRVEYATPYFLDWLEVLQQSVNRVTGYGPLPRCTGINEVYSTLHQG